LAGIKRENYLGEKDMNKLINKLVEAAGGWEKFLYETLKDVCDELDPASYDAGIGGIVDEAKEVIAAYEKTIAGGQPTHIPSPQVQPVVEDGSKVVEAHKPTTLKENKPITSPVSKLSKSKPMRKSRAMTARVLVDGEVGASQGELPVPEGHILTNREYMTVETQGGIELGRGSLDGQVRGQGVSGYVSSNGKYRLVFKDTKLGVGLVCFMVRQKEKIIEESQEKQE